MRHVLLRGVFVVALPAVLGVVWWLASDGSTNVYWPPLRTILQTVPDVWTGERLRADALPSVLRLAAATRWPPSWASRSARSAARRGVRVLSASPTVVREQLKVDLPAERDQLRTRVAPRFAELRTHVYEQIQAAKRGTPAVVAKPTDTPPPH